jgi:hypothetical protein
MVGEKMSPEKLLPADLHFKQPVDKLQGRREREGGKQLNYKSTATPYLFVAGAVKRVEPLQRCQIAEALDEEVPAPAPQASPMLQT